MQHFKNIDLKLLATIFRAESGHSIFDSILLNVYAINNDSYQIPPTLAAVGIPDVGIFMQTFKFMFQIVSWRLRVQSSL